jgi:electron transfer flavoprotein alpha subunit
MVASLYNVSEETREIWVFLEQQDGVLENVSLELLGKGRQLADELGWQLTGLLLGNNISRLAETAFTQRVDKVWLVDHPLLERFTVEGYSRAVFQSLMKGKPGIFLLGATHDGRDLAARLAVRLRTGLNADCTNLSVNPASGVLVSEVSGFGGGVLALIEMQQHRPQMATVRPGVFPVTDGVAGHKGEVTSFQVELTNEMIHTRLVERKISESVDLTRTPVLVAGGRGVGMDFSQLAALASLLGGEVGATRPPVDMGYIERERQIGQTGVTCSPEVAICCGISGAFHFIVGIEKAGTVIAINADPEAPIFEYADYSVTGDAQKILPALIDALRNSTEVPHA